MSHMINVDNVTKRYERGGEVLTVLDNLCLTVDQGDFVSLMGPSGSGKTTILNCVGGIDTVDAGTITVNGEDVTTMPQRRLPDWRAQNIGFVFQSFNLVPVLTAMENVILPLQLTPLSRKERKAQAIFALEIVGLADRMGHRPSQLSGGQEQRVAIARAIATDPAVILADEPTGDLDRENANAIMELLQRLNTELGKTIVVVTHDHVAAEMTKRILHLDKGVLERTEVMGTAAAGASAGAASGTAAS